MHTRACLVRRSLVSLRAVFWKQSAEHWGLWELYSPPTSIRHSGTDYSLESFSLRISSFPFGMRCNVPCTQLWQKTGCSGRQWEWYNDTKKQTIQSIKEWSYGKKNKGMINAVLLNVWFPSARIWQLAWIVRIEYYSFFFVVNVHMTSTSTVYM